MIYEHIYIMLALRKIHVFDMKIAGDETEYSLVELQLIFRKIWSFFVKIILIAHFNFVFILVLKQGLFWSDVM